MNQELLDIVDDNDNVVGFAPREDIYNNSHMHRIVHILIFNSSGKMLLQKRSKTKSFAPLHWSTAVGGHVQSGEGYKEAALREFEEELGVKVEVEFLYKDIYSDNRGLKKFIAVYKTIYDGEFMINKEEVESVAYFSLDQIREMIAKDEKFHPEILYILGKNL